MGGQQRTLGLLRGDRQNPIKFEFSSSPLCKRSQFPQTSHTRIGQHGGRRRSVRALLRRTTMPLLPSPLTDALVAIPRSLPADFFQGLDDDAADETQQPSAADMEAATSILDSIVAVGQPTAAPADAPLELALVDSPSKAAPEPEGDAEEEAEEKVPAAVRCEVATCFSELSKLTCVHAALCRRRSLLPPLSQRQPLRPRSRRKRCVTLRYRAQSSG